MKTKRPNNGKTLVFFAKFWKHNRQITETKQPNHGTKTTKSRT